MKVVDHILWWGTGPSIGVQERFSLRGWRIVENQTPERLEAALLSVTRLAILNYPIADDLAAAVYQRLPLLIMHGVLVLVVGGEATEIRGTTLPAVDPAYPWDEGVRLVPSLKGVHFDTVVCCHPERRWHGFDLQQKGRFEKLGPEDELLVKRAFQEAEEVHLRILSGGLSGSRVFMAHEKRTGKDSSIAHWRSPRLVKLGTEQRSLARSRRWKAEIEPFYELHAISNSPSIDAPPNPESWLYGCLQRIRAFGIYDQSSAYEYPIALVIALWRWCKFPPSKSDADRGRRVIALELGYRLMEEIVRKHDAEG